MDLQFHPSANPQSERKNGPINDARVIEARAEQPPKPALPRPISGGRGMVRIDTSGGPEATRLIH
jgi:hypothetical protein